MSTQLQQLIVLQMGMMDHFLSMSIFQLNINFQFNFSVRPDLIRIGAENLTNSNDTYGIEGFIVHPEYRNRIRYHDIALIKFKHNRLKAFKPACLWQDFTINFTEATVTGYGHEHYGKVAFNYY